MKTNGVIALSLFALTLTSCDKDDDDNAGNTITDIVVSSDDFSTLESAVLKANVQTTL
ncbi:MAG: fasciclin domain-containing protein, partial [Chitinophagaceae bacterium]